MKKRGDRPSRNLRYGHDPQPQTWPDRENLTSDEHEVNDEPPPDHKRHDDDDRE